MDTRSQHHFCDGCGNPLTWLQLNLCTDHATGYHRMELWMVSCPKCTVEYLSWSFIPLSNQHERFTRCFARVTPLEALSLLAGYTLTPLDTWTRLQGSKWNRKEHVL